MSIVLSISILACVRTVIKVLWLLLTHQRCLTSVQRNISGLRSLLIASHCLLVVTSSHRLAVRILSRLAHSILRLHHHLLLLHHWHSSWHCTWHHHAHTAHRHHWIHRNKTRRKFRFSDDSLGVIFLEH